MDLPLTRILASAVLLVAALSGAAGAAETADGKTNAADAPPAAQALKQEDVTVLLGLLPMEQRDAVLGDEKAFKLLAEQEAQNRAVLAAARANGMADNPDVKRLMQRGADRVLADVYLNQVIRSNLPADFPSDAQVKEYFEKNKEKFEMPERVHLWQIYIPVDKEAKPRDIEALTRKANALVLDLRKRRKDFDGVAAAESQHQQSRLNGGYLGLLRMDELLVEVRAAIKGMKENDISHPIRTESGIHIVKRGATVPAQTLAFEDVQLQIRQLLVREAIVQTRAAVLTKIAETYPVTVDEKSVEQWRQQLNAQPLAQEVSAGKNASSDGRKR
jgi:peptidylprolyl isomerase